MFERLRQLKYAARVLLSHSRGEEETIEVAGRPTRLRHGGQGPPFLYLHSALGEAVLWLPFYQSWARHFHVLVPTHPGFGAQPPAEDWQQFDTIEDLAFHYIEFLDTLGLEQVYLGGVSLGGWLAAEIAVRWPERVRKLWLCGAPGLWVEEAPPADLFRIAQDRRRLRELLFHDPQSPIATLVLREDVDEDTFLAAYHALTLLARLVWERPYNPKLARRLHRIRCPVLLLWGAEDRLVPPAHAREYQKHLPQAKLQLLPACGHLPMFECEKEFVETILRFCQEPTSDATASGETKSK